MSNIEDKNNILSARIAVRLKEKREALSFTLADLAARSSVSKAMISKVERGEASPTAACLGKLCSGLGITISSLMAYAEGPEDTIRPAKAQPIWRDPETGYIRTAVSPDNTGSKVEIVRVELLPGAKVAYEPWRARNISQHIVILNGELTLTVGERTHQLTDGDCIFMQLNQPLVFTNHKHSPAHYFVVLQTAP